MAASLIQQKRKLSELGDITNSTDNNRKKIKQGSSENDSSFYRVTRLHHPQQERLPLPTDTSGVEQKKQVTFASATYKKGVKDEKTYHESPLLTPKEDEDFEDEEYETKQVASSTSDQFDADMDKNTDYMALLLTLRLLYSSKQKIHSQIVSLSQLLEFHSNSSSKEDVVEFVMKLINNELELPGQNKIIKTPLIDWSRYHKALNIGGNWHSSGDNVDNSPMFKTLHLFEK